MWKIVVVVLISSLSVTLCDNENYPPVRNLIEDKPLKIITRSEWLAVPPMHSLPPLALPAKRVIIAHTASDNCTTLVSCIEHVQDIQKFHVESRGFDDIAYNFLVGGDGFAYVGRGWDYQGAHTKGFNANSICIAFIGNFNEYGPANSQLNQAQKLIEEGVKMKKIANNYNLYGHQQLTPSQSPGTYLYNIIKKWPHWTDVVQRHLN